MKYLTIIFALAIAGCEPYDPCDLHDGGAYCDDYLVCAQCSGSECQTWFEDPDSGRTFVCDGRDRDGNGYENCVDDHTDATCSF